MKVLCIDASGTDTDPIPLIELQIYEAIQSPDYSDSYKILEIPPQIDPVDGVEIVAYKKSRFIPLSDIDETELALEREQLQTV